MNRYILSFIATFFIYIALFSTFLFSYQEPKTVESKYKQNEQKVKFTIVSLEPKVEKAIVKDIQKEIKKVIAKKEKIKEAKKVIKPKPKPKKIVKPKPKNIIKKTVKKPEPKKIKEIKKAVVKKETIKKPVQKKIQNNNISKNILKQKKKIIEEQIKQNLNKQKDIDKKVYLTKLKETISKNKSYPRSAIRRELEGDVKISLTISPNGELLSFKIVEGNRIFKKSIQKSVQKSFPLKPKKDIFLSNLDLSLTISYRLF